MHFDVYNQVITPRVKIAGIHHYTEEGSAMSDIAFIYLNQSSKETRLARTPGGGNGSVCPPLTLIHN